MGPFVSALPHQEVHSLDFMLGDNGSLNWMFEFQGVCPSLSEPLKGLKGDVTVAFRRTMRRELVFII